MECSLEFLPVEVLCILSETMVNKDMAALRCVSKLFNEVYSDNYLNDLKSTKLYSHQKDAAKFLLDRETAGLNSILNLDTGTGKTAVVFWAYKQNPVPTVALIHRKYHSIWINEMRKHGVNIPIITPGSVKGPLGNYKRIIMDEIHNPLMHTREENAKIAEYLKGCVIWGLSASKLAVRNTKFVKYHLSQFFGAPDCMMTLKISQLQDIVKANFRLPTFYLIDEDSLTTGVVETKKLRDIRCYLNNFFELLFPLPSSPTKLTGNYKINLYDHSFDYVYNGAMYEEYLALGYTAPDFVDYDGSFTLDGVRYYTVMLFDFLKKYQNDWKRRVEASSSKIKELIGDQSLRTIIYSHHVEDIFNDEICTDKISRSNNSKKCCEFISGNINTLILPPSYNAGFNFGKIDTLIIRSDVDYAKFHQMIGRINRLDQKNNTNVYIFTSWASVFFNEDNVKHYIDKYSAEFV